MLMVLTKTDCFPMKKLDLTDKNLVLYAAKYYDNHCCRDMTEFYNDLAIVVLIKKLLSKYLKTGILKDRLVINHLISFMNVFEYEASIRILFYKIEDKYHPLLKSILLTLERCPEHLYINNDKYLRDIEHDKHFLDYLDRNHA